MYQHGRAFALFRLLTTIPLQAGSGNPRPDDTTFRTSVLLIRRSINRPNDALPPHFVRNDVVAAS